MHLHLYLHTRNVKEITEPVQISLNGHTFAELNSVMNISPPLFESSFNNAMLSDDAVTAEAATCEKKRCLSPFCWHRGLITEARTQWWVLETARVLASWLLTGWMLHVFSFLDKKRERERFCLHSCLFHEKTYWDQIYGPGTHNITLACHDPPQLWHSPQLHFNFSTMFTTKVGCCLAEKIFLKVIPISCTTSKDSRDFSLCFWERAIIGMVQTWNLESQLSNTLRQSTCATSLST